jgi:hypothetical protein
MAIVIYDPARGVYFQVENPVTDEAIKLMADILNWKPFCKGDVVYQGDGYYSVNINGDWKRVIARNVKQSSVNERLYYVRIERDWVL